MPNGAAQGAASEPIVFTVPLPVAAAESAGTRLTETRLQVTSTAEPKATFVAPKLEEIVVPNGNGSHGQANGSRVPALGR